MPKISSLVFQVKTFWVFEWMPMTNGNAIAKNPEYFTTFHHGLELQLHNYNFTYLTLKYDRIDIHSKVFDGATCIPTLYRLLKNCANITRSGCQPDLVIPRPNRKDACTYGIQLLGTLKYDKIDIQSKAFDGATFIPELYRRLKNCANITRSGSQPLVIPRPKRKKMLVHMVFSYQVP